MILSRKKKKILLICGIALGVFFSAALFVTQIDFLGDLVLSQLNDAIHEQLNVDLKISPLTGNPLVGFKGRDVAFVRSGDALLTADEIGIKLSYISLIKNSPRVSVLSVSGLKSDYGSLCDLLPKSKTPSDEPKDIPIDKLTICSSDITTPLGKLTLDNSAVRLKGSQWFDLDVNAALDGRSVTANGVCAKKNGSWTFENFKVGLEKGSVKLNGAAYPSTALLVEMDAFDLYALTSLIPTVKTYGIKGHLSGSTTVKGSGGDLSVHGSGSLKEALVRGIPLSKVDAKWDYDKGLINVEIGEGKVFNSSLTGKLRLDTRDEPGQLDFKLCAKNLSFADWTNKFGAEVKNKMLFLGGGITSLEADLKGPLNALVGKVEIAPSDIRYNKMRFSGFGGSAVFGGGPTGKVDFSALCSGQKYSISGVCGFAKGVHTDLNFSAPRISLDDLGESVPALKEYDLSGTANASAKLSGLSGQWTLTSDVSSPSASMKKVGDINNFRFSSVYSVADGSLAVKNASVVWNGAAVSGSGRMTQGKLDDMLSFAGTYKNLDMKKLYELVPFFKNMNIEAVASGTWKVSGPAKHPSAAAKVVTGAGRFIDMKLDKFSTDVRYADGKIVLDPMRASGYGGNAQLKCVVGLASPTTWKVDGNLKGVDASAVNGLLKMKEPLSGKCTLKVSAGNSGGGLAWKADIAEGEPKWKDFRVESLKGAASGTSSEVRLNDMAVTLLRGTHKLSGTIKKPEGKAFKHAVLDLHLTSDKINVYEALRKHMSAIRGIQGLVKGSCAVSGTVEKPVYNGTATLAQFRYRGFMLPMVDVTFDGNMTKFHISHATAKLRDGSITGRALLDKKADGWYSDLSITGSEVDLKQFGAYLPEGFRERLGGKANFSITGEGRIDKFAGKGKFESRWLRFMGVQLRHLDAPFYVADGYAIMEDVKAEMNGGQLNGGAAFDLNKSTWGANVTATSVDVDKTVKQAFPNIKGRVTGLGSLKLRGGGETGRISTIKAGGAAFLYNGEITSFDAVEAAKKYTAGNPLRFATVQSQFTYDGGDVTLLPGSRAVAPKDDPVYNNVMLDGLVTREKKVSMFAMGKVNIRALNALLGAMQGIVSKIDLTGASQNLNTSDLIRGVVGGVLSGFTAGEFRFITMNIGGSIGALKFDNIKIDRASGANSGANSIPKSSSDPKDKDLLKGNTKIALKFEIPTGPGTAPSSRGVKGQVVQQTLENLLNNVEFGE
ncbi:MAG: hypothetical protein Q4F74_00640 [Synergistaceae bacterium]|nr:hypothetical protein [Synergistaceae bacterium]